MKRHKREWDRALLARKQAGENNTELAAAFSMSRSAIRHALRRAKRDAAAASKPPQFNSATPIGRLSVELRAQIELAKREQATAPLYQGWRS